MPTVSPLRIAIFALGTLAAAAPRTQAQPVDTAESSAVQLPAFIVAGGTPWRYAHPPGFEILSRWPDSQTKPFARDLAEAQRLLDAVLPPEFQAQLAVPTAYVLVPDTTTTVLSGPLMAQVLAHAQADQPKRGQRPTEIHYLPNLMLWDRDALLVFSLPPTGKAKSSQMIFANARVRVLLERRIPALPQWFIDGFCDLYDGMVFKSDVAATGHAWWLSPESTAAVAADPESPRPLLPLAELFANPPVGGRDETPAHGLLRQREGALFIRWALDGDGQPRSAALWRLVADAAAGPVTERHFQELFGEGFGPALNDLSDYLPWALTHSFRFPPAKASAVADMRLRDATPAEVGRIKGDLERLEMNRVAAQFPELVPKYREQALVTLTKANQEDKTDPSLLAVTGLFDLDCDYAGHAEQPLAAAVAGRVVRPRAYFELARLRLADETRAAPPGPPAQLNAAQTASLLDLLNRARAQAPPLPEVYGLNFEVWQATATQPDAAQLQVFRDSVRLFPANPVLLYQAAVMLAQSGFLAEANEILQRGLGAPVPAPLRSRMTALQEKLAAALRARSAPPGGS